MDWQERKANEYGFLQELKISSAAASYGPDPRRSSIFAGLTFLFPTQDQLAKMCSPVQLAGKFLPHNITKGISSTSSTVFFMWWLQWVVTRIGCTEE